MYLDQVEEAHDFQRLVPGGYICQITSVSDVSEREYLKIEYEIMDGQHKGYCRRVFDAKKFWPGNFIKSYKQTALPFFKGMVTAIEQSNQGFKWDNDERKLVGKWIGLVLAEEEYAAKDKTTIKTRLYVAQIRSGQKIRNGDFEIPPLKEFKPSVPSYDCGVPTPDSENPGYGCDDVPF